MLRRPIKFHKGTSSEIASYTGEANSIVINTETNRIHVQNGTTAGGIPVALKSEVDQKQNTLVSGDTIKTINGQSVVGSGNLVVGNLNHLGLFASLAALKTAYPTGTVGQQATIAVTGEPDKMALWDTDANDWVESGGTSLAISSDAGNQAQLGTDNGLFVPAVDISGKADIADVGNKANLTTTDKTTLVASINELDSEVGNVLTLPRYYFSAPNNVASGIYTWGLLYTDISEYYYGYNSPSTPENFIVKLNPTTGVLTSYTIPNGDLLTSVIWELRATYAYTTLNTYLSDLENFVSKDLSSAVVDIYSDIKPHYTTNQNVTVANKMEFDTELTKALRATYEAGVLYTINLPSTIDFQITLQYVNCPNLHISIPIGGTVDCTSFSNNYFGFSKVFILMIGCNGIKIHGTASTSNGTGVASIVSVLSTGIMYVNPATFANLELSGFENPPIINNHLNGAGVPKITGYTGQALFNGMQQDSEVVIDGSASFTGDATVTLTGSNNVTLGSVNNLILKGNSYTGTATVSGSGSLDKQSSVANYSILGGSSYFTDIKINSNNWNELSYTDIQALTPSSGLKFYDTTWKVGVRGDGTNWIPQSPIRVYAAETNDVVSNAASNTLLRAVSVPFKYLGDKGRIRVRWATTQSGSSGTNYFNVGINNTNTMTGVTNFYSRSTTNGNLNGMGTKTLESHSRTKHYYAISNTPFDDVVGNTPLQLTFDTSTMTHIIFSAAAPSTDTVTLQYASIEIMPMFS